MSHLPDIYAIINISDIGNVNFSEIGETDATTIRKSVDELFFVIKWSDEHEPSFISNGSVIPTQILDHSQCIELMQTEEWQTPIPPDPE